MKNGKRLTVKQRLHLKSMHLNSENWLISKKEADMWTLVHRYTGTKRIIPGP